MIKTIITLVVTLYPFFLLGKKITEWWRDRHFWKARFPASVDRVELTLHVIAVDGTGLEVKISHEDSANHRIDSLLREMFALGMSNARDKLQPAKGEIYPTVFSAFHEEEP